jgi:type II pantothenate kinase
MAVLPLIKNPDQYRPFLHDLATDTQAREYWLDHFEQHTSTLEPLLVEPGGSAKKHPAVDSFIRDMLCLINDMRQHPENFAPLTILALDAHRQNLLKKYGFDDPYKSIKTRENQAAIRLYPKLIDELAAHQDDEDLLLTLVKGIFAGNIFDMGSLATVASYNANGQGFFKTRQTLCARPWLVDDFDALVRHLLARVYRKVLFFVDNSGADFVLGCLPFARHLAERGATVVLVASSYPTLNDITFSEVQEVLDQVASLDPALADLLKRARLTTVPSGTGTPLIDLSEISFECAEAALTSDFLILEGMGRAIESNYHTAFTCPTLKIALLKDKHVADTLGGQLYDAVCRFELPNSQ